MTRILASVMAFAALGAASAENADSPYPEYGTEAWRAMFAVDPAKNPLGEAPFDLGEGITYSTALKGELAGFNIGQVNLQVLVTDKGYRVDYQMVQRGIARWFSDGEATSTASGIFGQDGEIVSTYYYNHDMNGEDDQQQVELYREADAERYRLWSLPEYTFRQPVSVEQSESAIDPLAALVALAFTPVPEGEEPCERRAPVMDGRRRFDLVMKADGQEYVRKNGPGRFKGDTYKCRLFQEKVAGYKENDRGDIDGELWVYLAEVPDELKTDRLAYVPVRIVARSGIIGASLQAKRPTLTGSDGTQVGL